MSVSLQSQTAGRRMAADISDQEQIDIGKATERKRRREGDAQIEAILQSDGKGGRAVYWRRSIRGRDSVEVERAGTYSPRAFLRMAEKAAGQAGKGRWNRPEAVEAVAAELVARTLTKTGGTMPIRGSLGRQTEGHENPDLAYLTVAARRLIVSAQRGDTDAAGLAAEAAPIGEADSDLAHLNVGELMAESEAAAEGPRDPYLADPVQPAADLLCPESREAVRELAEKAGQRPAAVEAAVVAALRAPVAKSADLADAGYASSPGSARKAAQRGRDVLRTIFHLDAEGEWATDGTSDNLDAGEALAYLCEIEDRDHAPRHIMEGSPHAVYRRPNIDWPTVTTPEKIAPVHTYRLTQGGE